jgi:hypothetical protein
MKLLLGHVLVDRKNDNNEVILQLDEIQAQFQLHDYKVNLLAKKIIELDLTRATLPHAQVPANEGQPSTHL